MTIIVDTGETYHPDTITFEKIENRWFAVISKDGETVRVAVKHIKEIKDE